MPNLLSGNNDSSVFEKRLEEEKKKKSGEEETPVVSIDYMFMESGNAETELGMPTLVVKDRKPGVRATFVVPRKGRCSHAAKRLSKVFDVLGYRRLVLKSGASYIASQGHGDVSGRRQ